MDDRYIQLEALQQKCCRAACKADSASKEVHESILTVTYWPVFRVLFGMKRVLEIGLQEDVLK